MSPSLRRLLLLLLLSAAAYPAQAVPISYIAYLDGPSESPPNASPGTGFATFLLDTDADTFSIHVEFTGLLGPVSVAHIHGPTVVAGAGTAGVMTMVPSFAGFPDGVTSGVYDIVFTTDATFYNPAFVTANGGTVAGAEAAFAAALADGKAYLNIHSSTFPAGEIRGFLAEVPEPGSLPLLALGCLGLVALRRRHAL